MIEEPVTVLATKWEHGWELEIDEDHHTQADRLSQARQEVVDFLDVTWPEDDHSGWEINIVPDLASASLALAQAREAAAKAEAARSEAAKATRAAVKELVGEGVTQADIAFLMGVSKARVSQLLKDPVAG